MSQPQPENPVSQTAVDALTKKELEGRIEQRRREMETAPCYRCGHSPASPDTDCPCCKSAHTPDIDGRFKEDV